MLFLAEMRVNTKQWPTECALHGVNPYLTLIGSRKQVAQLRGGQVRWSDQPGEGPICYLINIYW